MRTWQRIRDLFARPKDMKPERTQNERAQAHASEVPMTAERMQTRVNDLSADWSLVTAPVALRYWHRFPTFVKAAEFVANDVAVISEHFGFEPTVRIAGSDVELTLGITDPRMLAEIDFDFARAIDGATTGPAVDDTGDANAPAAEDNAPAEADDS